MTNFELYFESKYIYRDQIVSHQFDAQGNHRLSVSGDCGEIVSYEEIAVYQDYMALSDYLSPADLPIVLHLVGGRLDPLE